MGEFLRWGVQQVAAIHDLLLRVAHRTGLGLTDKDLHLLVMGVLGMVGFFVTYGAFRAIERRFADSALITAFVFTLTNLIVVAFAIEIGQRLSGTGAMEFLDIAYGLWGFVAMFTGFLVVLGCVRLTRKVTGRRGRR